MLFNSLIFPFFLAFVLTLHWALPNSKRNLLLLIASYTFYAWWDYRFLGLIVFSSAIDYLCGLALNTSGSQLKQKLILSISLIVNLGVLGIFKYLDFFVDSLRPILSALGFQADFATLNLLLPVGISFYTFQSLSYTIDIYRGRCDVCRSPTTFFLFVAFFPQLVAGPIERASNLIPQLATSRTFKIKQAVKACRYILWGYVLKTVLADNLSPIVDHAFTNAVSGGERLYAAYCFSFQILGDFAGYSFIAIGVAALFGVTLSQNFRSPYLSQEIREFWSRWHMTLGSWFREYVYIAWLGGNQQGRHRQVFNVLFTFTLSGLWHGANWTFIIWGMGNGLLYFIRKPFHSNTLKWVNTLICFHLITLGWVIFRADSIASAKLYLIDIIVNFSLLDFIQTVASSWVMTLSCLLLVLAEIAQRNKADIADIDHIPSWVRTIIYLLLILSFVAIGQFDNVPFIYFQF